MNDLASVWIGDYYQPPFIIATVGNPENPLLCVRIDLPLGVA
jgi:hypothetical protein